jgi:hypothetical protein
MEAVGFTHLLLYPRGNSPHYSLHWKMGGPHNRFGREGVKENLFPYRKSNLDSSVVKPIA